MEDDFYSPASNNNLTAPSLLSNAWQAFLASPSQFSITFLSLPVLIFIATRLLSGRPSVQQAKVKNEKSVWLPPYWLVFVGHGYQIFLEPLAFMSRLRDKSPNGVFALYLGGRIHNIISDPKLVENVMQHGQTTLSHESIDVEIAQKFFGIPKSSLPKYQKHEAKLTKHLTTHLLQEPALTNITHSVTRQIELNIPQMISFLDTDIDMQPWERRADSCFISNSETEINLMSLLRDMMGNALVPAIFGHALLEKYPDILHEVYDMDEGMWFFLMGVPSWFPWAKSVQAHLARQKVWRCMDDYQRALDALAKCEDLDSTWGDLDDVSELMLERNKTYREGNFDVKERADTSIVWSLTAKYNMLAYWTTLQILSKPSLLPKILAEIAPYVTISEPISIGSFSEAPKLSISHQELSTKCPILKACYLETLRLTSAAYTTRLVQTDTSISSGSDEPNAPSFAVKKGEYVTAPHALHMRSPSYFPEPEKFDPDRFLVPQADGTHVVDTKDIHPYGVGTSMCQGRLLAETGCMALVAGVLVYYEIKPVDGVRGWVVPAMHGRGSIAKPVGETRVRIRRREFQWGSEENK